jgi:hypothetical protein
MTNMRVYATAFVIASAMMILPASLAAQNDKPEKKIDLTGKWTFSVVTDNGTGTPTVTLKQQGDTLTGHYSSQTLGEVDFKGTVKGQAIRFVLNVDMQGTAFSLTYSGTIEADGTLKGTVDFGGMGSATFTAKRQ